MEEQLQETATTDLLTSERADEHGSTVQLGSFQIRDRIRELRRVRARDLLPNPKNWRRHPKAQAEALRGLP